MAKYKLTNTGVFDTEKNLHIPDDSSNRLWKEYQEWLTQGAPLNQPDPADSASLSDLKLIAKTKVDVVAENVRSKYITVGSGQAMVYIRKEQEAEAYKDAGYPAIGSPNEYPHLTSEANNTGQTEQEVADIILSTRDFWIQKSSEIEGERLGGKKNIDDAANETAIDSAKDAAISALEVL